MGTKRANADERRLAHVRAIRDAYYGPEKTLEHQLADAEAQIEELTAEVERLRALLGAKTRPEAPAPEPEDLPAERRNFDFYRD